MMYDKVDGARLNTILNKKIFKHGYVGTDEVKNKTGLSIEELILCWLFDSKNNFQKVLSEWVENDKPMNFKEIQGY